ncbi:hypothetical protein TCAL_07327 [Tigriopus californicus]|uniref:Nucleoporin NDC1 n=1 Tax=Tigriopus californicus TaxID=6832 RepID=A0A553NYV1_TIGCA|nr:nucleoporin NDC1-like [Tigriopus californicus]TRY70595.1 hypothetical protein TCAL_07327 [Tigriopus californicus]|eukprot:TCALIF_07327-PA protein Name:"Similar to NDC1 Nucleoporin NDC1 (Homo sapiens)" AED:0.00 eAED:0.00 QI:146/1/1/1/0.71/0.62/8/1561/579
MMSSPISSPGKPPSPCSAQSSPAHWFEHEIFRPRITNSIIRHALLTAFLILVCHAFFNAALLLHPLTWMSTTLGGLFGPSSWLYLALVLGSTVLLGWLVHRHVSTVPFVPQSALSVLWGVVEVPVLLSLGAHLTLGALLTRSLMGIWGGSYGVLTQPCLDGSEFRCIDESHILLVQSGAFMGGFLWFGFHFRNGNLLHFPPIRQHGSSQLRSRLAGIFQASFIEVILNMRWFCFFYIVYGHRLAVTVSQLSRLSLLNGEESVFRYLWHQMVVLAHAIFLDTFVVAAIKLGIEIHNISLMKPVMFPVDPNQAPSLVTAMKSKNPSLMKYLAYMDFKNLSTFKSARRQQLFELSQPGGHPRKWTQVSQACVSEIEEFMGTLQNAAQVVSSSATNAQTKESVAPISSNLRYRFHGGGADNKESKANGVGVSSDKSLKKITNLWDKLVQRFSKNKLFTANPELSLRNAFAQCQIVIWAIEGLSQMIAASVLEDDFGVVQRNLSEILTLLLNLQQTVERYKGLSVSCKQAPANKIRDIQLKQELRSAVKTSIYRITNAFGSHVSAISVPAEFQQKLDNYTRFQE